MIIRRNDFAIHGVLLAVAAAASTAWAPNVTLAGASRNQPDEATDRTALRSEFWSDLQALDEIAASIETLTARFTQRKHTPLLKEPLTSSGQVRMKGKRMLWETRRPRSSMTLVTEEELRVYFPDEKALEIYPLDDRTARLVSHPVPRLEILRDRFEVSPLAIDRITDERALEWTRNDVVLPVRLQPSDERIAEHVQEVHVLIDRSRGHARRLVMISPDGERTTIEFSDVVINEPLEDGQLKIETPRDVKISRPLEREDRQSSDGHG